MKNKRSKTKIKKKKYVFLNNNNLYLIIGEGNSNPLQYSCLENSMEGGVWRATVRGSHKELDTTE